MLETLENLGGFSKPICQQTVGLRALTSRLSSTKGWGELGYILDITEIQAGYKSVISRSVDLLGCNSVVRRFATCHRVAAK